MPTPFAEEISILDSVSDGITVNSEGIFLYVNEPFAKMVGYEASEIIGMHVLDFTAHEFKEIVEERTRKRQQGHKVPPLYDLEILRKDGTRVPVEFSSSRIDFNGKSSSLTIIRDVSERERTLVDYISVFETLSEPICIFDKEKFIWANEAYLKFRGYNNLDEFVGRSIINGIHPQEKQEAVRVVKERTMQGRSSSGVWRIRNDNGSYQTMDIRTSLLPGFDKPLFVGIVSSPDTDQEEAVSRVTKGDLINEINSAMTVIMGYIDILKENNKAEITPDIASFFTVVEQNYARIKKIVDKIE